MDNSVTTDTELCIRSKMYCERLRVTVDPFTWFLDRIKPRWLNLTEAGMGLNVEAAISLDTDDGDEQTIIEEISQAVVGLSLNCENQQ